MPTPKFSLAAYKDEATLDLMSNASHKALAAWAFACGERALPHFEEQYPQDRRPRNALDTLQNWITTGEFKMAVIRKASLDAHAAAREVGADTPARSAARSAGQAVATAHVRTHALGAANYALQAIHHAAAAADADAAIAAERAWQLQHLLELGDH
ncbi:MAG: hypothetical protein HYZ26_06215 [Chloroflexi bacterium]|nr:hypothetical protein [Chloroflexota bacterium]